MTVPAGEGNCFSATTSLEDVSSHAFAGAGTVFIVYTKLLC